MFRASKEDIRELRKCCLADDNGFEHMGTVIPNSNGNNNVFIKNQFGNDAPVLAIAHIDTAIHDKRILGQFMYSKEKQMVVCSTLDDRLGIWALTQKLPKFIGHRGYDILLTTGEETGKSSAKDFSVEAEKYNWIFELDRRGCDAVTYGFTDKRWITALEDYGWDMGWGSFTDISMLEQGTVSAVNFGIGYNNAHSENCFAFMEQVITQLIRVAAFYRMYDGTRFKHSYKLPVMSKWTDDYYTPTYKQPSWNMACLKAHQNLSKEDNANKEGTCQDCETPLAYDEHILCSACYQDWEGDEEEDAIQERELREERELLYLGDERQGDA